MPSCICSPVVTDTRPAHTLGGTGVLRRTAAIRGAQPAAERCILCLQAVDLRLQRLEVLLLPCP